MTDGRTIDDGATDGRPTAAVVGGGPAGLIAAEVLAGAGWRVTVHDHMPSMGRKLLLAGRGGLNITHGRTARPTARTLWLGPDAARASTACVGPRAAPRLVRGSGRTDLRRLERSRVPVVVPSDPSVARVARPPRQPRRAVRSAPSTRGADGRRRWCARRSRHGRRASRHGRRRRGARARRRELAAGSAPMVRGPRCSPPQESASCRCVPPTAGCARRGGRSSWPATRGRR